MARDIVTSGGGELDCSQIGRNRKGFERSNLDDRTKSG